MCEISYIRQFHGVSHEFIRVKTTFRSKAARMCLTYWRRIVRIMGVSLIWFSYLNRLRMYQRCIIGSCSPHGHEVGVKPAGVCSYLFSNKVDERLSILYNKKGLGFLQAWFRWVGNIVCSKQVLIVQIWKLILLTILQIHYFLHTRWFSIHSESIWQSFS